MAYVSKSKPVSFTVVTVNECEGRVWISSISVLHDEILDHLQQCLYTADREHDHDMRINTGLR